MPRVMDLGGISGVFTAYLCLTIPGFLLVAWYPRHRAEPLPATRPMSVSSTPVLFCLAAILVAHLARSEEHTSELQSQSNLVCRLLLEKKKTFADITRYSVSGTVHLLVSKQLRFTA